MTARLMRADRLRILARIRRAGGEGHPPAAAAAGRGAYPGRGGGRVSFATQLVVAGKYQRKPPLPFAPGTEVAGTVLELAPDVADPLPPGTRVFAVLDWGGLAEEAVADAIHVVPIPDGLPLDAAVAMPISYPTAGSALMWRAQLAARPMGAGAWRRGRRRAWRGWRSPRRSAPGSSPAAAPPSAACRKPAAPTLVLDSAAALPRRGAGGDRRAGVAAVLDTLGGASSTKRCAASAMAARW